MKKVIALMLTVLMVLNLFAFAASAADLSVELVYPQGSSSYNPGDQVIVKGNCPVSRDLVLRVYDQNSAMIYTDVITAEQNTEESYEFPAFKLPNPNKSGNLQYQVYISYIAPNDEKVISATMNVGGGSDPIIPVPTEVINSWVITPANKEEQEDVAYVDKLVQTKVWADVGKVTTENSAVQTINKITSATDASTMQGETARNNVAVAAEIMTANIGAKVVPVFSNQLNLTTSAISASDLQKLDRTMSAIKNAIAKNSITLNRELEKELVLKVQFKNSSKATITISRDLVKMLVDGSVDLLTIQDTDFKISYTVMELQDMLGEKDSVSFTIDKSSLSGTAKKIAIDFDVDNTQHVKIAFPGMNGNDRYMAIVDENGKPVGGRYNPATGVLEAKITASGVYQVVNNEKDFADIKHLTNEMQESIKILAAKGIIEGTSATEFSPEDSISRAEIAALLLRVLAQVDPNADGGFADVKQSDWFFGTAGSAKKYGMIIGFNDGTFRGNDVIEKDQILTIASRVLQKEMKYKAPADEAAWLNFADAENIADWARSGIALANMANIITRAEDNTIHADQEMTRGDAALIIMRLFYKIW